MRKELRNGEQLTDEHINMAQGLLKEQFPFIGGFQNCLLSQTCGFTPQEQESIQIHFVARNHWCVSSSIGKEITVYDSKLGNTFCSSFTHQLALIYKPLVETKDKDGEEVEPELAVMISDVQQQKGMADCGLFSVAFALHLALGDDPSCLLFEQSPHLIRYNYCSSSYIANNP